MASQSTSSNPSQRHNIRDSASLTSRELKDRAVDRDHDTSGSVRGDVGDWEDREALRQRELEEAKGRAAQMEKTMRWWSDCTASWREKWSKVRTERNQARDECKQLKTKLEASLKEFTLNKTEKEELVMQNEQLLKEMEKMHIVLQKHGENFESQLLKALSEEPLKHFAFSNGHNGIFPKQNSLECDTTGTPESEKTQKLENRESMSPKSGKSTPKSGKISPKSLNLGTNGTNTLSCSKAEVDDEFYKQKLAKLQHKLDEAMKCLLIEKEEKTLLIQKIEILNSEIIELKEKLDELRDAKQEVMQELLSIQDHHEDEIKTMKVELIDSMDIRKAMDKMLNDLRAKVEHLQAENLSEWDRRERTETEKLNLERENKRLSNKLRDMQERLEKKVSVGSLNSSDLEFRHLQKELYEQNKELSDIKNSHSKLKKALQDKTTELSHALRRTEQYESEVKKLRCRIEELKHELTVKEDELDAVSSHSKKLQRTNEELQEQVDSFQVQLQHLHTRLHSYSNSSTVSSHKDVAVSRHSGSDFDDQNEYF